MVTGDVGTSAPPSQAEAARCCPTCGLFNPPGAVLCDCGCNFATRSAGAVKVVRPWIRYWARMFDLTVFSLPVAFGLGVVAPNLFSGLVADQLFGISLLFVWVFVEALLLSLFGTTPGKWLF